MEIYGDCSYCGGRVTEKLVKKVNLWGNELTAIIDNVPAGVCDQCGERYYRAGVLKNIEKLLKDERQTALEIKIPVIDCAGVCA